ncbi:FAD-dependent monooxygenase [Streptomyces heilongjiangensis]|uniref:FAD-dependent monooxygenase n=1 Tax=Streptomyces heilongjiangensis TaxID=945052 RepID=A0ABW1B4I3_9ACTN|nr:FAD-dependent monooxygenase [Streptomyces heilongjiangensis]MDC2945924.1 FAD-dependent monooxygenase [Streptomyces heilongjiangensis]
MPFAGRGSCSPDPEPPLRSYAAGRVARVGDAAHAMTPHLGQGACQALEDAVVLADRADASDGLHEYDLLRRPRTQYVARRSRLVGRVAQWSSRGAVALRDGLVRAAPADAFQKSLKPLVDWSPPACEDRRPEWPCEGRGPE